MIGWDVEYGDSSKKFDSFIGQYYRCRDSGKRFKIVGHGVGNCLAVEYSKFSGIAIKHAQVDDYVEEMRLILDPSDFLIKLMSCEYIPISESEFLIDSID